MLTVMRKAISIIMLLAAVATAFISCNKQTPDVKPSLEDQMLVFTSERPSFSDDVKTHWEEAENAVYWSKGDKIRMAYTINGVWQGGKGSMETGEDAKLYESVQLGASTSIASFAVPIASTKFNKVDGEVKETGDHVFYSIYPSACSEVNFDSEGVAQITVSTEQSPSDVTFDSKSDVMIGESVGDFDCIEEDVVIPLKWSRLVAHAKITLKSLKEAVEGEIINSIVLTAQDGADMTGTYTVDLMTGDVSTKSGSNVLSIAGASLSAVDASKNVSFWACMMPCTWKSLKVIVDTDKATYTRQINLTELGKEKTFLQNRRNLLTINMSDVEKEEKEPVTSYFTHINSLASHSDLKEYILVYEKDGTRKVATEFSGSQLNAEDIVYTDEKGYAVTTKTEGYTFRLLQVPEATSYYIWMDGNYIGYDSSTSLTNSSELPSESQDKYQWNITFDNDNVVIQNVNTDTRYLKYYQSGYFKAYTSSSGNKNIKLYVHP